MSQFTVNFTSPSLPPPLPQIAHDPDPEQDPDKNALLASNVIGSHRQLWSAEPPTVDSYIIRPSSTSSIHCLSSLVEELSSLFASNSHDTISHIQHDFSRDEFKLKYGTDPESSVPLILENCTTNSPYPAGDENWSLQALTTFLGSSRRLEIAQTDSTVSLCDFTDYVNSEEAKVHDNPVMVFETLVDGEHDEILSRFTIPSLLTSHAHCRGCHVPGDREDLLSEAGEDGLTFGLHRWMILGPHRSGSNVHIDPLGTSAWNTLLLGRKLWVIFPPDVTIEDVRSEESNAFDNASGEELQALKIKRKDFCAAGWFTHVLPNLPHDIAAKKVQFVQNEGDTVFVPAGWSHAVLNLTFTVCVTQNLGRVCDYDSICRGLYSDCLDCEGSGDSGDCGEDVDLWRENVVGNGTFNEIHHNAVNKCVHCSNESHGNVSIILYKRPICKVCEKKYDHIYRTVSESEIEDEADLVISELPLDEVPVNFCKNGRKERWFLAAHVGELLRNEFTDDVAGCLVKNLFAIKR